MQNKIKLFFSLVLVFVLNTSLIYKQIKQSKPITNFTIIIDPGHGGIFAGAKSATGKFYEKELTLEISKKLANILKSKSNFNIILTRETDRELHKNLISDLLARAKLATDKQADLFVSLHLNSTENTGMRGFEIFVPMKQTFDKESYLAASYIHQSLSQNLPSKFSGNLGNLNIFDRGIRAAKFNVLAHATQPAVLIEIDYISNPAVEKELLDQEYLNKIAQSIGSGIIDYLNYN